MNFLKEIGVIPLFFTNVSKSLITCWTVRSDGSFVLSIIIGNRIWLVTLGSDWWRLLVDRRLISIGMTSESSCNISLKKLSLSSLPSLLKKFVPSGVSRNRPVDVATRKECSANQYVLKWTQNFCDIISPVNFPVAISDFDDGQFIVLIKRKIINLFA